MLTPTSGFHIRAHTLSHADGEMYTHTHTQKSKREWGRCMQGTGVGGVGAKTGRKREGVEGDWGINGISFRQPTSYLCLAWER